MTKLWGGRFSKKTHPWVEQFTRSIDVDKKLAEYDVIGSLAHVTMLGKTGIIPSSDAKKISRGLTAILMEIKKGNFRVDPSVEDIHTHIQQMLSEQIGKSSLYLHTARSRNDQVCLDMRLYCKDATKRLVGLVEEFQRSLVILGKKHQKIVIPGCTHLQHAQPVYFAHHMLAYVEMCERDKERLQDAYKRIDVCPLGSLALAGSTLPIDRELTAKLLTFSASTRNSLDAVSDRDFLIELLSVLSIMQMHLSRLAEDMILWASAEFNLIDIDECFCTGSSLMPHKKNPDVLELIRGATGQMYGNLVALLTMMKGLPLAYNRDMQWDKKPFFETVELMGSILEIFSALLRGVRVTQNAALLADESLYATDIAEYLVKKKVPFRQAHEIVGKLIRYIQEHHTMIRALSQNELAQISPFLDEKVKALLGSQASLDAKVSLGSTGTRCVAHELARWDKKLTMKKRGMLGC